MALMHKLFEEFKKTVTPKKLWSNRVRNANTGSLCAFLHKITVYFLFLCFIIVSNQQLFGSPIRCISPKYESVDESLKIPENVINSYCFIASTYSVVDSPSSATYPGIGPHTGTENLRRHAYYQWVPLVLLLQAILFMIPNWLWKGCEGGLVERLITPLNDDLEKRIPRLKEVKCVENLANYFYARLGSLNRLLGTAWVFCDVLALMNVVGNFFLIDALFDGMFFKFGLTSLQTISKGHFNASLIFPLLTKCSFHTYGYSGSVQLLDSICVMTLNIVNEKVYFLLWIWLLLLTNLTILLIIVKVSRILILKHWSMSYVESTLGVPTRIRGNDLQKCAAVMSFGDCVLFHILAKSMHPMTYTLFVKCLSSKIATEKAEKVL